VLVPIVVRYGPSQSERASHLLDEVPVADPLDPPAGPELPANDRFRHDPSYARRVYGSLPTDERGRVAVPPGRVTGRPRARRADRVA